ncbi:MAG: hypothetical protein ACNA71_10555, partial [Kiritimatiellia bacterium]
GEVDEDEDNHEVMLEAYDWRADDWHALARGTAGQHAVSFDLDGDLLMRPYRAVILRQRVLSEAVEESDPLLLHSHSMRLPGLPRTSLKIRVVPEGAPDA